MGPGARRHSFAALLASQDLPVDEIEKRIRVIRMAARGVKLEHFELAATAVLTRRRLGMTYRARYNDQTTERGVSPQHLEHYRGNRYLDGLCHAREDIRSFAVDGIQALALLDIPYSDDRELLMDILKYGPDCEVLAPRALRSRAERSLAKALQAYRQRRKTGATGRRAARA